LNWRRKVDLVGLAGPHQAGVDEDARELVPHRLVHQRGGHGRVHSAAQRAQHSVRAHLGADGLDLLLDDGHMRPPRRAPAHVHQEVVEHLAAPVGVHHLGMELQTEEPPRRVVHGRHRRAG
jgi:hypothetical protein